MRKIYLKLKYNLYICFEFTVLVNSRNIFVSLEVGEGRLWLWPVAELALS